MAGSGVASVSIGVLDWAHAAIGEAIHNRDSNRAGVFMGLPWRIGVLAGCMAT
jgi:hypothetical protein